MDTSKRGGVKGSVWAMAFTGFAILAIGYFAVLLQAPAAFPWPQIALGVGLAMLFAALPLQYVLDVHEDRRLRHPSPAKRP